MPRERNKRRGGSKRLPSEANDRGLSPSINQRTPPCTYDLGYVRQDVYACLKCKRNRNFSGFCGGCRIACHGDHPEYVIDLYSKRNFRCDCGNQFMKNTCMLEPQKLPTNADNSSMYSQNFIGLYCRCRRGFDSKLGDMSQCVMCEDWFHAVCIQVPGLSKREALRTLKRTSYEFVCRDCVFKLPLLAKYYYLHGMFKPKSLIARHLPDSEHPVQCSAPAIILQNMPPDMDYCFKPGFREQLCACTACLKTYEAADASYVADEKDYSMQSCGSDVELLDDTADSEILRDVLAESCCERILTKTASWLVNDRAHQPEQTEHFAGGNDTPQDTSENAREIFSEDSDDNYAAMDHRLVQMRIRDFLHRSIDAKGGPLTHSDILTYVADLKAELLYYSKEMLSPSSISHGNGT